MKVLLPLFLSIFISTSPSSTDKINNEVTVNGLTYLYGEINSAGLTAGQYKNWFNSNYSRYVLNEDIMKSITRDQLEGISIKLLMGTWCGDSKRNVPVFYKFIDKLGITENQVQAWGLDRQKKGPGQEEQTYNVTRVPTIIFYRNGREIGRFVERPQPGQKLEAIWASILRN